VRENVLFGKVVSYVPSNTKCRKFGFLLKGMLQSKQRVCQVCTRSESKYCCPRCKIPYCSVDCYRSHGEKCTEAFYAEHVKDEVSLRHHEDKEILEKRKLETLKIAQRSNAIESQTTDDYGQLDDLATRLENVLGINIDQIEEGLEKILDDVPVQTLEQILTDSELKRFKNEALAGKIIDVEPWQPWWRIDRETYHRYRATNFMPLVVEGESSSVKGPIPTRLSTPPPCSCPNLFQFYPSPLEISEGLPQLKCISSAKPSPDLLYHACNVIWIYIGIIQQYNGDMLTDKNVATQAAEDFLRRSRVLNDSSFKPTSIMQCIEISELEVTKPRESDQKGQGMLQLDSDKLKRKDSRLLSEFIVLVQAPKVMIVDALLDSWFLFFYVVKLDTLESNLSSNQNMSKARSKFRKRIRRVERKLWFLLLWANENMDTYPIALEMADYFPHIVN